MTNDKKSILIVDDEATILSSLSQKFASEGYNVFQAKDGEEGLALALKEKPDVVLLDIIMPKLDGMTLLKRLKSDAEGKNIPVVILTNLSGEGTKEKGKEAGATEVLVKAEVSIDELVNKIEAVFNK